VRTICRQNLNITARGMAQMRAHMLEPLSIRRSQVTIGYSSTHFSPSHSFLSSSMDVKSSPCSLTFPQFYIVMVLLHGELFFCNLYETTLAILHKVALATHKHALIWCVCHLNVEPIGPDTILLYLLSYSYYMNCYMGVCKMLRCSSLFRFSIEWVSAYPLIFFLPTEIESVSTTSTDHYDLTVVHQISVPLGQNISWQCQEVL